MSKHSKRDMRLHAKKRKIEAFLQLARMNDEDRQLKMVEMAADSSEESDDESERTEPPPVKRTNTGIGRSHIDAPKAVHSAEDQGGGTTGMTEMTEMIEEKLNKLRSELRSRQKASMEKPKIFLTVDELYENGDVKFSESDLISSNPPLFVLDLQHLLLSVIQGNLANYKPRWCKLLRWAKVSHLVVIVMDQVSIEEFLEFPDSFPFIKSNFEMNVEMICPNQYGSSVIEELSRVPLSGSQIIQEYGYEHYKKVREEFHSKMKYSVKCSEDADLQTDRLRLLLSPQQMIQEKYPLPIRNERYYNYVYSRDSYDEVTNSSPMFALDVEMCLTEAAQKHELTRVAVVNEKLEIVYDELVKPRSAITNYLTQYSGITEDMLKDVTTRIEDVQRALRHLLPADAILCGQSLNGDLQALQMFHPYVIDTSVIYNLSGIRRMKTSLKKLTATFLDRDIQNDPVAGHNPCEDAKATMELVQLKLANGVDFGDVIMGDPVLQSSASQRVKFQTPTLYHNDQLEPVETSDSDPHSLGGPTQNGAFPSAIERRQLFFKQSGINLYRDLFEITVESKRTAAVIGQRTALSSDTKNQIAIYKTKSDKETVKQARKSVNAHFLTVAQLHAFASEGPAGSTKDEKQDILRTLDKKVKKMLKHLETNSVVVIVMSGRATDTETYNSSCFVKVT